MPNVVDYEEFSALIKRVERVEIDNDFLKSFICSIKWMSRTEAMELLGVSSSTLHRMTKRGKLDYLKEGENIRYSVQSIFDYLLAKKIDPQDAKGAIFRSLNNTRKQQNS